MRKKRGLIALGVVAGVLALAIGGLYWAGRSLFYEPTAQHVDSVIGELGGERVLGVFAHPDDEQTVNGLFWRAKDRDGAYTAMITATRGEAGHQSPVVGRQEDLGEIRKAESLMNSFNLGVDRHVVWDFPDGGVPEVDEREIVDAIIGELLVVRPDVVVTFWPASGATGHKDHMRMGELTEKAIAEVAQRDSGYTGPRWIVYTISPTKALEVFGGERGRIVVENQPDPDYSMPAEVGKKHDGWRIHASQANYMQDSYILPNWITYALWDEEFYAVRDLEADPLR